jgi:hypothetical protein
MAWPRFPIGNLFRLTPSDIFDSLPEPVQELELDALIPDPMVYGPNYVARTTEETANPKTLYSPGNAPMRLLSSEVKVTGLMWAARHRSTSITPAHQVHLRLWLAAYAGSGDQVCMYAGPTREW